MLSWKFDIWSSREAWKKEEETNVNKNIKFCYGELFISWAEVYTRLRQRHYIWLLLKQNFSINYVKIYKEIQLKLTYKVTKSKLELKPY